MTTITFDTLEFVETLTTAGFSEKQAKALSSVLNKAQNTIRFQSWSIYFVTAPLCDGNITTDI